MTNAHQAYLAQKYFPGLNGVRAIAIIAVIWHHTQTPDVLPMFTRGFVGVDLFFVLSGFLISTLLIREKSASGKISLKDFWMRRILRLVPAYYLLLFALLAAYLIFKPGDANTQRLVEGFPVYALYLSNWFHPHANNLDITWSLATEEQFYLIWPLFEAFALPIVAAGFWGAALVINQLINFGVLDPALAAAFGLDPNSHPEILETTFTPILLGVGLAHVLNRAPTFRWARKIAGFRFAPIAYAGLLLAALNIPAADISGSIRLLIHAAMTLWIASIILLPPSAVTRALEWRPIALVGVVSYGMYLYHMWCVHVAKSILSKLGLPQTFLQFAAALALTLIVSVASYYLYEKRFLDMRKKFRP